MKVQSHKCNTQAEYLGHIISTEGIRPNPEKIAIMQKIPVPKTIKQIRSFLGLTGFYRMFIRVYSKVALPQETHKNYFYQSSFFLESFEKLKELICSSPILAHPNFCKPFTLTTDATQP